MADANQTARPRTRQEALDLAVEWATGRRSHINVTHAETQERRLEVVAVLDAQEVVKWAALAQALPEGEDDAEWLERNRAVALALVEADAVEAGPPLPQQLWDDLYTKGLVRKAPVAPGAVLRPILTDAGRAELGRLVGVRAETAILPCTPHSVAPGRSSS